VSQEKLNLKTHVEMCELRYQQLNDRIQRVENQINQVGTDLRDFKQDIDDGFSELKQAIVNSKDSQFRVMVTTAGTVIVALLGLLGYIVVGS